MWKYSQVQTKDRDLDHAIRENIYYLTDEESLEQTWQYLKLNIPEMLTEAPEF